MPEPQSDDFYFVPSGLGISEIRVKASRFVARATSAVDEGACTDFLGSLRRMEHDATHHCSAWRTGPTGSAWRANDDGEPSGSAGLPILRQIEAANLTNCIVVVTRYYGGTKLGTGGLVRAYGESAALALEKTGRRKVLIGKEGQLTFSYEDTAAVTRVLKSYCVEITGTHYTDETSMRVRVPRSLAESFAGELISATRGRVAVDWSQEL